MVDNTPTITMTSNPDAPGRDNRNYVKLITYDMARRRKFSAPHLIGSINRDGVSISSDTVLTGAPAGQDRIEFRISSIFSFDGNQWNPQQKLTVRDIELNVNFESPLQSVVVLTIVDVQFNDNNEFKSRSAYMIRNVIGQWMEEVKRAKLEASPRNKSDSITRGSGNSITVGTPGDE